VFSRQEVVSMARTGAALELDDELLRNVDAIATRAGTSRAAVLEDSVRRGLAARALGEVLAGVRARGGLVEDSSADIAYGELRGARAARRPLRATDGSQDDPEG
jgi:predicted transcriptional regulator